MTTDGTNTVTCKAFSPLNADNEISVRVDIGNVGKLSNIAWSHKLFAMYYNILGYPPPYNNVGYHEKDSEEVDDSKGILDAHAVFQGLKRPHIDEDGDKQVYIYICKPAFCYKRIVNMTCTIKRAPFPDGAVFAIYLNLDDDGSTGEVFNWEFVKCDADDPTMPEDFKNRYDQRRR